MKVLRTSDVITLKQNELEIDFSPLSWDRSLELSKLIAYVGGKPMVDQGKQTALMIKYAVKEIRGLTDWHGKQITLVSQADGLNEEDVSTAVSTLIRTPFIAAIAKISTSAVPEKVEGVELLINGQAVELGN